MNTKVRGSVAGKYDTVAKMKAGSFVLGQQVENKATGTKYIVEALGIPDGYGDHATDDGNFQLTLQSTPQLVVNVIAHGALPQLGDARNAFQSAIDKVDAAGGGVVLIPAQFNMTNAGEAQALLCAHPNTVLMGYGEHTGIVYTSDATDTPCIYSMGEGNEFLNFKIDGTANATKLAQTTANCHNLHIENSDNCKVRGMFSEGGHYGVSFASTTGNWTTNRDNEAVGNKCWNGFSSGIDSRRSQGLLLDGNLCYDRGTDGIKTGEGTRYATIVNNRCHDNTRDGIDLFDGFIESLLGVNHCWDNGSFGFECKGTFGGTYAAGDYVFINNSIVGNVARGNGADGFSVSSVRNCTFTGNDSVSNALSGFNVSTVQGCTFVGGIATRNTQHGYNLAASVSRSSFTGCFAIDNSWDDGTIQNGTYHGFNLENGCAAEFTGCTAGNGTTAGQKGGQGYGILFTSGGSSIVGGSFDDNVTDDISGASNAMILGIKNDIGLRLNSFGSFSSNADAAITGYVNFVDEAGVARKLATIA